MTASTLVLRIRAKLFRRACGDFFFIFQNANATITSDMLQRTVACAWAHSWQRMRRDAALGRQWKRGL